MTSILPCVLAALMASGCGSGSDKDNDSNTSPPGQPAAFGVSSTNPSATTSATTPRDAGFSATFNGAIDAASADAGSAQLVGPEGNVIPATVAVSGSTLKLTPQGGSLPGGTTYTAKLSTALKSTSGQALPAAVTTPFTTTAQQWEREITRIDRGASSGTGTRPVLAVGPDGAAALIWAPSGGRVADGPAWFSRMAPGSASWSTPAPVALIGVNRYGFNAVAAPNGNVHLGYVDYIHTTPGFERAHVATFDAATSTWSTRQLSGTEVTGAPTLSVDPKGNVTALLQGIDHAALYISRLPAGGSAWSPLKVAFAPSGSTIKNYAQALDKDGNLHLAWNQSGAAPGLYTSRYAPGSDAWSAPVRVDANADAGAIRLVIDDTGGATLAWQSHPTGAASQHIVLAARRPAGAAQWSIPAQLSDASSTAFDPPLLAVSPAGVATVLYHAASGWTAVRSPVGAQTFDRANAKLVLPWSFQASWPSLTVDRAGNLNLLFYSYASYVTSAVRYATSSGAWEAPAAPQAIGIGPSGEPVRGLGSAQAVLPNGDVLAVWSESLGRDGVNDAYVGATRYR